MNAILPEFPARKLCFGLMDELDSSPLGEHLRQPGNGRMFGVLTCTDGTVYKAYSGQMDFIKDGNPGNEGLAFVPPLYDSGAMQRLLGHYDDLIKASEQHRELSKECWNEVLKLYRFHCHDGLIRSLYSIFPKAPSGTGDCCAPRLLCAAYRDNKEPASMCEFFYGSGSYEHKSFHTPCDSRCKPILKDITGLDIVYCDDDIVVVNKSSGMLSIEGKGPDKQDCIASRVRKLYPGCIAQPCIHRLDQATSGLMVLGLTKKAHDILSLDFEKRRVAKEYEALVDGLILEDHGTIDLPIRLDPENRPHQIVDLEHGKKAVTDWMRTGIENIHGRKCTRLRLIPHTGRTHQLRVHCAFGLGKPILGDALYGTAPTPEFPRLMLQARVLEFSHPVTGKRMRFELESEF